MGKTALSIGFMIYQHLFFLGKFSSSNKISQQRCPRSVDTAR